MLQLLLSAVLCYPLRMSRMAATKEELDAQLRRTGQVRRIIAQPALMCATSFCNAPLAQSREELADEIGRWLDATDDRIREQQPKTGGRPPKSWTPHYPGWLARVEAGEHLSDILTAAGITEKDERRRVRRSFERYRKRMREKGCRHTRIARGKKM
jgi:hypothetical protein